MDKGDIYNQKMKYKERMKYKPNIDKMMGKMLDPHIFLFSYFVTYFEFFCCT